MARAKYTLLRVGATATPAQGITLSNALRPFFMGAPGLGSGAAQISDDPGNILIQGTDQKLMVPGGDFDYEAIVAATLPL